MKRAALYARVSKTDLNLGNQQRILVNRAEREEWEYELFMEKESTRKTRPIKQQLLQRLREGDFDILAFTRLDRFARSMPELVMDVDNVVAMGVTVHVFQQGLTFSNNGIDPMARLQLQILAAFAEFERNIISERTKEGLRRARAEGKVLGRPRKKKPPVKHPPFSEPLEVEPEKTPVYLCRKCFLKKHQNFGNIEVSLNMKENDCPCCQSGHIRSES